MKRKLSVLLLVLLVLCAFAGCTEREIVFDELPEDSNAVTKTMERPTEGTPDDYTPRENLAIACGVVQAAPSYQSITYGEVTAKVAFINYKQTVINEKQVAGGQIYQEAISLSSLRKVAEQKFYQDGKILRRKATKASENPEWGAEVESLSHAQFEKLYGEIPAGMSHYILNDSTVLEASAGNSADGLYRFTYLLDTQIAPYYYAREMRTYADAYELPEFQRIQLDVVMDADWKVREVTATESYSIAMPVIGAINCQSVLRETFTFEAAESVKNADFFAPFLSLVPDEDPDDEPDPTPVEKTAGDLLTEAFGGYLSSEKLTFSGEITCGDFSLSPTLAVGLGDLSVDLWADPLYLGFHGGKIYLANSSVQTFFDAETLKDVAARLTAASGLVPGGFELPELDDDFLTDLLESAQLTRGDGTAEVCLSLMLDGLQADINIELDTAGEFAALKRIRGTACIAGESLELTLEPAEQPALPALSDFQDGTALLGYLEPAMQLVQSEHLQLDVNAEIRDGAEAYALTASALLDRDATAPGYGLKLGLTGAKELTASAYLLDGNAFLTLNTLKLAMPAEDVLPSVREILNCFDLQIPALDSLLAGDVQAVVSQLGLTQPSLSDFDALKGFSASEQEIKLVLDGSLLGALSGNDLTLILTRCGSELTNLSIQGLSFSGCDLTLTAKIAGQPIEVSAPEDAADYLTIDYETVKNLLGFVAPVTQLLQERQLHLDFAAQVLSGESVRFDLTGGVALDLTEQPTFALELSVTGESSHTVQAQFVDDVLYCVYNGKAMKIPYSALSSTLGTVLELLHLDLPLIGDLIGGNGPDTSILEGLGIPDLSAGLSAIDFNAVLKSIGADESTALIELSNTLLSGGEEDGNFVVALERQGSTITGLSASNLRTGDAERLNMRLGIESAPVNVTAPENADEYIDFTGVDQLIRVFFETAELRQYRITGTADLSVIGIDVSVPLEVRIVLDEANQPTVWGKLEVPSVPLTTNAKTDTYLYYRDGMIYFQRDLYKKKMVGFFKYEWRIDSTDYLKCTTDMFLADPGKYLVHMLNLTDLVGKQIKDAISGGDGDKGTPAFERILLGYTFEEGTFTISLSGAELAQDDNIGDIDLTLRYGADNLFTSLTAKVKMLDMITLNLNAALTDAGSPVDMSVFPENLESDARYQF